MGLTSEDKRAIKEEGYLLVPGLVPPDRVRAALRAINASLGQQGLARDELERMRAHTFCPELSADPAILGLFHDTPLATLADGAVGPGRVRRPREAQIALRFPDPGTEPADTRPHIDGLPRPLNGVAAGTLFHFTALAAVFLSDADAPFEGNFTVWPGSHRSLADHFAQHGVPADLGQPGAFPPVPLPTPRQLMVKAGDGLLAHYLLVHGVAPNLGPHVRYAVYFRLFHQTHDSTSTAGLADLWREWDGLH